MKRCVQCRDALASFDCHVATNPCFLCQERRIAETLFLPSQPESKLNVQKGARVSRQIQRQQPEKEATKELAGGCLTDHGKKLLLGKKYIDSINWNGMRHGTSRHFLFVFVAVVVFFGDSLSPPQVVLDDTSTVLLFSYYLQGGYYRTHLDAIPNSVSYFRQYSFLLYLNGGGGSDSGGGSDAPE